MSFLYPFVNFLQPGILWPALADLRPSILMTLLGLLIGMALRSAYPRHEAFSGNVFRYLCAFVVVQAISVYYGGLRAMAEEFFYWYQFPVFVAVSILLMPTVETLRKYVWGMICGSMFVVLYGIYAVFAFGGYEGTGRAGAYGMYDNHNDYTFIIIQVLPFLYTYMRVEGSRVLRMLLAASFVACLAGVALSLSRGGMIALVLELLLLVLLLTRGRTRTLLVPLIVAVGIAAVGFQYAKRAQNQGSGYTAEDAESSRLELWKAGANMLKTHPFLGVGSRRFPEFARYYYDLSHDQVGKVSHNTYVEVLASSGLLGFGAFFLMLRWLRRALKTEATGEPSPILEATRTAAIISLYAILFRALLDAKVHDWCFYVLAAIGIAGALLQRHRQGAVVVNPAPTVPADTMPPSTNHIRRNAGRA